MASYNKGSNSTNFTQLQTQVDDVKGVMTQNIDKILKRGDNLEDLVDKTTVLEETANQFERRAVKVKRKMWWQNLKWTIILVIVIVVVLAAIGIALGIKLGGGSGGGGDESPTTTAQPQSSKVLIKALVQHHHRHRQIHDQIGAKHLPHHKIAVIDRNVNY